MAELVCELLYAGKTRAEIAGYDDAFMSWVLCRPRDENGSLVRVPTGLPSWVTKYLDSRGHWTVKDPRPFSVMFHEVMERRGLEKAEARRAWELWRQDNPGYGEGGM